MTHFDQPLSVTMPLPTSFKILWRTVKHLGLFLCLGFYSHSALAWDSVGHRLSAAVALQFISIDTRDRLLEVLAQHPRYQQDFLNQMPDSIENSDISVRAQWLLGQAAYWPDLVRGLPTDERRQYHRPTWHYTDGTWVRGSALLQGNLYLGTDAFPDRQGEPANRIINAEDAHNIVTALDYNSRVLSDSTIPATQRAVALCWVLHLIGDIHQPLHTGSLYSAHTFEDGDQGGNRIPVAVAGGAEDSELNLHSTWDRALREAGVNNSLPPIMQLISGFSTPRIMGVSSDWTAWMSESRQLLQSQTYNELIKSAVLDADDRRLEQLQQAIMLDSSYLNRMHQTARLRLGLAGLRTAIWIENNLP